VVVSYQLNSGSILSTELAESESYVTTDGQSASLSWNKAPIWGLRPDFYYCQTVAGLLIWGVLSDEWTGLSFTIATGPRQRSHSRVLVPWDFWSHFTVSDSRLPFSSPPTTLRDTVEVFDPASTRYTELATSGLALYSLRTGHIENTASSIVACCVCWNVFTELLPSNALIKSVTLC
jgi:hypothetical protein